jgi:LCP family protein required for cell wall assembly
VPRAFLAGLFSAFVPGTGQLYAGARRRGTWMLLVTATLAACVLVVALQDGVSLLRLAVRPDVLIALLALDALVFAFRAHCTVDAYRRSRRARTLSGRPVGPAGGRAFAVALLLALVALPHVVLGYYDFRSYDVLTSVFASEEPVDVLPTGGGPLTPAGGSGGAGGGGGTPDPAPAMPSPAGTSGPEEPAPTQAKPPAERASPWKRGRVTFLLVGGDAGPYRYGLRTDTMIVVSVDTRTRRAALFGVPRNLIEVPFPASARTELETYPEILNSLWGYAEAHPELFPGAATPGPTALKETIGSMLGLQVDYFAAVDLRGFVELVDVLGGVTVTVQRSVYDAGVSPPVEGEPSIELDLEPGRHTLDGRHALAYVRTRWASNDYDRMHRQRCVMGALAQQASVGKLLRAFPALASTVKKFVLTDIPLKTLPDLVELLATLDATQMVGVSFVPPAFAATWADGDPVPDVELIRATVARAIARVPKVDPQLGLQTVRTDCSV